MTKMGNGNKGTFEIRFSGPMQSRQSESSRETSIGRVDRPAGVRSGTTTAGRVLSEIAESRPEKSGPACTGLECMQGLTVRRTYLGGAQASGFGKPTVSGAEGPASALGGLQPRDLLGPNGLVPQG
jgi:hypothetical protein